MSSSSIFCRLSTRLGSGSADGRRPAMYTSRWRCHVSGAWPWVVSIIPRTAQKAIVTSVLVMSARTRPCCFASASITSISRRTSATRS